MSSRPIHPLSSHAAVDFVLDLLQGAGIAAAIGIRPFLPVAAGRRARRGGPRARLRRHRLRVPRGVVVPARDAVARRGARTRASSAAASSPPIVWALLTVAVALGALAGRRLARRQRPRDRPGRRRAAPLAATLGFYAARSLFTRVRGAGSTPRRRRRCRSTARARRWSRAGLSILFPPLAILVIAAPRVAAARQPPPRGREVRRACGSCGEEARPRRHRRDEARDARAGGRGGRAPTLQLLIERGQHVDDCVAAFPSVTPVCAASIATGTGPDRARDPGDELVPPRRGALHRVRHELPASQAFGFKQSLTDTIYNMNLEHLSQGRADGVRAARRRRRAHRRHHVPDVPRPPPPRGVGRHRADPDRGHDLPPRRVRAEGALLRRHLRLAPHAVPLAARPAGHPRPALGLRRRVHGRARPVRLPALLAARQRHALAQERAVRAGRLAGGGRPPARAADGRRPAGPTRSSRTTR